MKWIIALSTVCISLASWAGVTLNPIFTDHMVLQRDIPAKVYGTAAAGERVTVHFADQTIEAAADKKGAWLVTLKPIPANAEPETLLVSGKTSEAVIKDVLVGDVWLCTGQSNMAGTLGSYVNFNEGMFKEYEAIPGNYKNDRIRLFTVPTAPFDTPQDALLSGNTWSVCDPESALKFSCTGYFFGKALQSEIGVPVGLIKSAIGGTAVGVWLPQDVMENHKEASAIYLKPYGKALDDFPKANASYLEKLERWNKEKKGRKPQPPMGPTHFKRPAAAYNGMIHPLHKFSVKGAIWYQGENEANQGFYEEYQATFKLMIETWRERWGQGDFPFIFVQLAAFKPVQDEPSDTAWARQRESQLITSRNVPNTRMTVAIDGGLTRNIHPPYKEQIGQRLAAQAVELAYGERVVSQGPQFKSMNVMKDRLILQFDSVGSGLAVMDMIMDAYGEHPYELSANTLQGFAVAGEDRVFHWAEAEMQGDTVIVQSPQVSSPVAVRYAWADFPLCNLYNKEGFPASPFRSDDWPMER